MTDFGLESQTCFGKEKCVGTIHKTVPKCGQKSIQSWNKSWWKVQNKRRSVLQWKRGLISQRVWLRQKVLEPENEDCSWFGGLRRLPLSAIATENKNSIANTGSRFHRARAKHCQNLQSREQNLCNARRIFRNKISRHISANQAQTHSIGWSQNLAKRAKHKILAAATQLCNVLRDAGMRNFSRNFCWRADTFTTDKGILPVSCVFDDKAGFVPAGRHPEHECFTWGPDFQSVQQPLWRGLIQKNKRRVWDWSIERFSLHDGGKPRPGKSKRWDAARFRIPRMEMRAKETGFLISAQTQLPQLSTTGLRQKNPPLWHKRAFHESTSQSKHSFTASWAHKLT